VLVSIAYYSRKGTTDGLAAMVAEEFRRRGHEVNLVRIKHTKRPGFLKAVRMSMKHEHVELENAESDFDMSLAEMVIVGGPIFAGNVNPFTRAYLRRITGLEGKPGGVFICCASKPEDTGKYITELTQLASDRGLKVKGSLVGSRKIMDRYPELAKAFVEELLTQDG
jgi:menaquinone-dependent protoporphyrinogen IX oxidase